MSVPISTSVYNKPNPILNCFPVVSGQNSYGWDFLSETDRPFRDLYLTSLQQMSYRTFEFILTHLCLSLDHFRRSLIRKRQHTVKAVYDLHYLSGILLDLQISLLPNAQSELPIFFHFRDASIDHVSDLHRSI